MSTETDTVPTDAVIAALDGSDRDDDVIAWAAGAASRSGRALHLLHSRGSGNGLPMIDPVSGLPVGLREALGDEVVTERLGSVRAQFPHLSVSGSEAVGPAERVLIEASHGAHLVVVGANPAKGVARFLGRSPLALSMHAACPVVLVPDGARTDADGPVVVGLDGSAASSMAAERAAWIADLRGTSVRAVATWYLEVVDGAVVTTSDSPGWQQVERTYADLATATLERVRTAHPDVPIEVVVRRGPAAATLLEAAADSSLLVVGSRGRGGFQGMLLGSVAHKLLEITTVPLMVVRSAS